MIINRSHIFQTPYVFRESADFPRRDHVLQGLDLKKEISWEVDLSSFPPPRGSCLAGTDDVLVAVANSYTLSKLAVATCVTLLLHRRVV